jgi:beta-1,4-N-acetylglucosaminyltransferase
MADIVEKTCVVTVGATAAFNRLVEATLQPAFLQALSKHEYTKLVIQYGKTGRTFFHNCLRKAGNVDIQIEGFDFKTGDFRETVRVVTAGDGRQEGMMIAHAGLCKNCQSLSVNTDKYMLKALGHYWMACILVYQLFWCPI